MGVIRCFCKLMGTIAAIDLQLTRPCQWNHQSLIYSTNLKDNFGKFLLLANYLHVLQLPSDQGNTKVKNLGTFLAQHTTFINSLDNTYICAYQCIKSMYEHSNHFKRFTPILLRVYKSLKGINFS